MDESLRERTAIITGGGSGLGKAIAAAYAQAGVNVVIAGRSLSRLSVTADELGTQVQAIQADVTDENQVQTLFKESASAHGRIDIVVNSAGSFGRSIVAEHALEDWNRIVSVNLTGTFLCCREAFRHMTATGGGRIINIGSLAAHRPRPESAAYSASKHAVLGLTKSLALDGREHGIVVSCLNPGHTGVERVVASQEGDGAPDAMMDPADVGRTALLMATLPATVNLLEATVLPSMQPYLGRS